MGSSPPAFTNPDMARLPRGCGCVLPGTNGLGIIKQGFLESSNVNVVEELVNMIQTQRAYEMNSKAISTTDQMLAKLSQL